MMAQLWYYKDCNGQTLDMYEFISLNSVLSH